MWHSKLAIVLILIIINTSTQSVWSLNVNNRVKRLINAIPDTNNMIGHEVLVTHNFGNYSGSIISDMFVLSAAHCFVYRNSSNIYEESGIIKVRAGIKYLNDNDHIVRLVEKVYIPSMFYHHIDARSYTGDIAVLKLNCKLGLDQHFLRMKPLKLPTEEATLKKVNQYTDDKYLLVTGFGATDTKPIEITSHNKSKDLYYVHDNMTFPLQLQYAHINVLRVEECENIINPFYPYYAICASVLADDKSKGRGVCIGDSGGSLYRATDNTIIGVTSFGNADCDGNFPAVYTRVNSFLDFIQNAMEDKAFYKDIIIPSPQKIRTATYVDYPEYKEMVENPKNGLCSV